MKPVYNVQSITTKIFATGRNVIPSLITQLDDLLLALDDIAFFLFPCTSGLAGLEEGMVFHFF